MTGFYIIYGIVLLLCLIVMMSMMVRWGVENDPIKRARWSTAWHGFSVAFRAGAAVIWIVPLWGEWKILLLCLFPLYISICWTLWDGVIALHLNQDFWYIGKTSSWDKWWNIQTSRILKLIVAVATLISIILYFSN